MIKLIELTKRNLRLYFRDFGAILFSLLSMLIVILLMVFFLGDMNVEGITSLLATFSDKSVAVNEKNAELLVFAWTCAGIISINAVTVTLAAYSGMIKDKVSGKINAIYTSSANHLTITASYVCAAWVASVLVCVITLVIVELIGCAKGLALFSVKNHLVLLGMIMLNSFVYAAFMYLLSHIAKTEGAWGGMGTVIGTLVGFLGGIYIPIGQLSNAVGTGMKCTPIIYGSAMFRHVMTEGILAETFQGVPKEVIEEYRLVMGIDLKLGEHLVPMAIEWLILASCGIIFLLLGAVILQKSKKADR